MIVCVCACTHENVTDRSEEGRERQRVGLNRFRQREMGSGEGGRWRDGTRKRVDAGQIDFVLE